MTDLEIVVRDDGGNSYTVTVDQAGRATHHTVTVWPSDVARYAPDTEPEALLEASFRFLLAREPRESILRRFDLSVIEQYFPEYPSEIGAYIHS